MGPTGSPSAWQGYGGSGIVIVRYQFRQ
jgi:hypothetical protein